MRRRKIYEPKKVFGKTVWPKLPGKMKVERVVFGPTDGFIAHLEKQGIDYRVKYDKRYPKHIDKISFIIEIETYKVYTRNKGLVGLSQISRELGKKKWQVQ